MTEVLAREIYCWMVAHPKSKIPTNDIFHKFRFIGWGAVRNSLTLLCEQKVVHEIEDETGKDTCFVIY